MAMCVAASPPSDCMRPSSADCETRAAVAPPSITSASCSISMAAAAALAMPMGAMLARRRRVRLCPPEIRRMDAARSLRNPARGRARRLGRWTGTKASLKRVGGAKAPRGATRRSTAHGRS
eukprot:126986-Chlamydomonas_euryale.AAC.11